MLILVVLTAIILGAGCGSVPRTMRIRGASEMKPQLIGNWEKITISTCSRVYPKVIEFRENGLFSGVGTKPGNAPGWDVGTWEVVSSTEVKISTMNDAIITYEFSLEDDILTFVDADKCEFQYRKVKR
jgi:hypothetical protein